ncbi:MAG: hypothetical protein PHI23_04570 [Candidatus Peribacteraceae bacterium]|nr:hypothetical protein [Candidatus Peribacteraceae bacterium]
MKKVDAIQAVSYANVPEGTHHVQREIGPGVAISRLSTASVSMIGARLLEMALSQVLADVPDDVDLEAAHFERLEGGLRRFLTEQQQATCVPAVRETIRKELEIALGKLREIRGS